MRARNVLCTLGIGALAMSVSAYAAPREAQTGKSPRPESSRLIAGQGGEIRAGINNGVVATGGGIRARLKPVAILSGSGSIALDTATLDGGPAVVKFEGFYGGWGATGFGIKTVQVSVAPVSAVTATCTAIGVPAACCTGLATGSCFQNGGSGTMLSRPIAACNDPAGGVAPDCVAAFSASTLAASPADLRCSDPFASECNFIWQETHRADYITGFGLPACSQFNITCGDTTFGPGTADNGNEIYAFSMVLAADSGAAGTYTIDFAPVDPTLGANFLALNDPGGSVIGFAKTIPGIVNIPLGRCCTVPGTDTCTPNVTKAACNTLGGLWAAATLCPADGGPICAECTDNGDCNDGDACTTETCNLATNECVRGLKAGFTGAAGQCCDGVTGVITNVADDGDPCTVDQCVGTCPAGTKPVDAYPASTCGSAGHVPAADGAACSDGNPCSAFDACTSGLCAGTNINGAPCVVDDDCRLGGTPGAVCDGGTCLCALNPNVSIVLSHDDPDPAKDNACYTDNEKVTATVHVGPAANTLVGYQLAMTYDTSCLNYVSIQSLPPYNQVLMLRLGGQCAGGVRDGQACGAGCGANSTCVPAGTIFLAAGINLGGVGLEGNTDIAVASFTKKPGCVSCDICFSNINPLHTYFSDNTGQQVGADTKCSDEIRTKSPIDLTVPDDVKVNKGCDSNVATVTWPAPSAGFGCNEGELVCNGIHLETGTAWDAAHVNGGGVFPGGNSNFCCVASNDCGNVVEKCWTVTVNDETSLEVEVQLSPTMDTKPGGGITRCIKFEVFNNCVQTPVVFETDLVFGGLFDLIGHFNGHIKIPAAVQPACITARDQKHTLRSCYTFGEGDCDANGVLHATFKQDPFFGGNWLIGGNLDGWKKENPNASHDIIDILDFGSLVAEWLNTYDSDTTPGTVNPVDPTTVDGNTPCGKWAGNHADINGDGIVDISDFSFIAVNFLDNSKDCCCPGSASLGNTVGRTEISVRELREQGMSDLSVADLNADGKVDMTDMAALMQGVRPNLKANDGGKDGSRSNNRK